MPNHIHLVLVPSAQNGLSAVLHRTQGRYARAINAREKWNGQLWQGRFASFVMDERISSPAPATSNSTRSGPAWSPAPRTGLGPAPAHLDGPADPLTDPAPLVERWPDWRSVLEAGEDEEALRAIRERERSGRPLGSEAFLQRLERATGLALLPRRRGRRPARPQPSQ
jgi:putative transposase